MTNSNNNRSNLWYKRPLTAVLAGAGAITGGVQAGCLGAAAGIAAGAFTGFTAGKIKHPTDSCTEGAPLSPQAQCFTAAGACFGGLVLSGNPPGAIAGLAVGGIAGAALENRIGGSLPWVQRVRRPGVAHSNLATARGNQQNFQGQAVACTLTAQSDNFQMNETVPDAEWRYTRFTQANQTMAR